MRNYIFAFAMILVLAACAAPKQNPIHVTLLADGTRTPMTTEATTVLDVLQQGGITLNDLDRVRPPENVAISDGMTITVTRRIQHTETETQTVPFTQQTVRDATVPAGQSRVIQAGRNGTLVLTYRLTFEDGVLAERTLTRRDVIDQPVQEVMLVGIEAGLSATPFSGTIAYISNNNAFVMRQATSNRRALTTSGDLDRRVFALSPDGKWLLFTREVTQTAEGEPLNSLWVVDTVLANTPPKLLKTPGVIFAGWSPDGNSIAYSTAAHSSDPNGWRASNDLWVAGFRGGILSTPDKILAPSPGGSFGWWGATYAWAPDGKSIAIGATDSISVVDLRTRKPTTLMNFPAYNTFSNWAWTPTLSWMPDSQFVVAVIHGPSPAGEIAESSPVFDVWSLAPNGSLKARLSSSAGMWAAPSAGPAGILFGRAQAPYASADSRYDLFEMDRDGSNATRLFPANGQPGLAGRPDLAFSPDGTQIVIAYQRDLYFVGVPTGTSQQITTEGNLTSPQWSR